TMLFFFQAEDGIRAFHVTGVQTCALPICLEPFSVETVQGDPDAPSGDVFTKVVWHLGDLPAGSVTRVQYAAGIPLRENTMTWDRSEERRVGKRGDLGDRRTG